MPFLTKNVIPPILVSVAPKTQEFDPDAQIKSEHLFERIQAHETRNTEVVDFYDRDNPNALVNLLPEKVRRAVLGIPVELHLMRESRLRKHAEISDLESLARVSFWNEYLLAKDNKRTMRVENIYSEVCSREYFYRYIVSVPEKLAYIIRPMKNYQLRLEELLDMAQDQMREIMMLPITDKKGIPNIKLIGEKIKIFQITENRVKGSVVNRVHLEKRSLNVTKNVTETADGIHLSADQELAKLEAQLQELREPKKTDMVTVESEIISTDGISHGRSIEERTHSEEADGTPTGGEEEGA